MCKGICLEVASCICAYPDFRLKVVIFSQTNVIFGKAPEGKYRAVKLDTPSNNMLLLVHW